MVEVLLAEMKSKGGAPAETPAKIHRQNHAPGYELSRSGTVSIRADFKVFRGNASLPHLFQNAERPVRRRRDGGNPRGKLFYPETSEATGFPRSDSFGNKAANGANTEAARKTNGSASAQSARRAAKRKSGRNFNMANVEAGRLLRIRRERL